MAWHTHTTIEKKKTQKKIWVKCKNCHSHIYESEWNENLNVCPNCNYHGSITSYERINLLFDENSFEELFANISPTDSLKFNDLKGI